MTYEGEQLTYCPINMFNFANAYAVVVSGARLNPYGHMLLNTGGRGGVYFQVSEVYGYPRFMNEAQFQRYLKENHKVVVSVMRLNIPEPLKSEQKLEEVMSQKWAWGMVVHNCESLVEEIVMAGGGPKLHEGVFPLPMLSGNACDTW